MGEQSIRIAEQSFLTTVELSTLRDGIQKILDSQRCDCPLLGRCEVCSGPAARMRDQLRDLLNPPKPMTVADYGASISISISELGWPA